jgi:hypothetical protein
MRINFISGKEYLLSPLLIPNSNDDDDDNDEIKMKPTYFLLFCNGEGRSCATYHETSLISNHKVVISSGTLRCSRHLCRSVCNAHSGEV